MAQNGTGLFTPALCEPAHDRGQRSTDLTLDFLRDGPSHCKEQWRDKRRQDSSKIQTSAAKDSSRIQMIEMAKAAKSRHGELELVDVASRQTLKKGRIRDFLPRAGETVLRPATKSRPWNISWTTRTKRASLKPKLPTSKSQSMRNASADFRS